MANINELKLAKNLIKLPSITPKDALQESAKILIQHFMLFSDERISLELEERVEVEEFDESSLHMRQLLKTKLSDMDLSVRALNCLKAIKTKSTIFSRRIVRSVRYQRQFTGQQ